MECLSHALCIVGSLFMRGVCLMVDSVRHISYGDAFKVGGLANVVLLVSIRNIDLQSLGPNLWLWEIITYLWVVMVHVWTIYS